MAGLAPAALAWADLDREWGEFWAALAARAPGAPPTWFTPERRQRLQALLDAGEGWLAEHPAARPEHRQERGLYACHLRRLQPALESLQRDLAEAAAALLRQREQLQAARAWAGAQAPSRGSRPRTATRR